MRQFAPTILVEFHVALERIDQLGQNAVRHNNPSHNLMRTSKILNEIENDFGLRGHYDHARTECTSRHILWHSSANRLFGWVGAVIVWRWKGHVFWLDSRNIDLL